MEVASERMEEVSTPSRLTLVERLRHGIVSLTLQLTETTTQLNATGGKSNPCSNDDTRLHSLYIVFKAWMEISSALYQNALFTSSTPLFFD